MKYLDTLGQFKNFNYVLYTQDTEKLSAEYEKMFDILKASGFVITSHWELAGGILLEDGEKVIAGIFFNADKFSKALLVHLSYVDPEYRKLGIYTQLHHYLDLFAIENSKDDIYSYIHLTNEPMVEYIAERIGYVPLMQLVKRPVKK
jgi:GNAT superfamily N-acetyltransferase